MKRFLPRLVRDLHLYLGLFISPFILVFGVSVFYFVHAWRAGPAAESAQSRVITGLTLPAGLTNLTGRPQIDALKPVLAHLQVPGEVGFIQHRIQEGTLVIPVSIPGRTTQVTLDLVRSKATVETRETGLADALLTLHKSPGGHGPTLRMNWFAMKAWRWFADATVYLTLFLSVSGVYLWYLLRTERRIGILLLLAGALTFFGTAYAISH